MRKACPKCKSSNTRVLSAGKMQCRNCWKVWTHVSRTFGHSKNRPKFLKGKLLSLKPKQRKVHSG